jgi:hypothetical protein
MTKSDIKKVYIRLLREKNNTGIPLGNEIARAFKVIPSKLRYAIDRLGFTLKELEQEVFSTHPELFPSGHRVGRRITRSKEDLLLLFAKFRKELGKPATRNDIVLYAKSFTRGEIEPLSILAISHYHILRYQRNQSKTLLSQQDYLLLQQ